jgi:hypothetical protein
MKPGCKSDCVGILPDGEQCHIHRDIPCSSAPELLAVLKAMQNCFSMDEAFRDKLFDRAEEVIAKAEGKE